MNPERRNSDENRIVLAVTAVVALLLVLGFLLSFAATMGNN
jgi:succinate dehydrogenase hydrophobic anchor subunit